MMAYSGNRLIICKLLYTPYNLYQLKMFEKQLWLVHLVRPNLEDKWYYCTCGINTMVNNNRIHIKSSSVPIVTHMGSEDIVALDSCGQNLQSFIAKYFLYQGI